MESTSPQEHTDSHKGDSARALQEAKRTLEDQIEHAVATHESSDEGAALEVALNFEEEDLPEGEGNEASSELMSQVRSLVDDFHASPAVTGKGVRVRRLTAADSDGDGEVAVRVDYDHAGYQ